MKYLDGLNEEQRQAILNVNGPVLVLAGAGSGKTRVLTTRIYHLIRENVPPERILAVTFTNKAAREMRDRVQAMLGEDNLKNGKVKPSMRGRPGFPATPFIATFHSLGRELLENYGKQIGIPRYFSIYDRNDSEKAIAAALKNLDVSSKEFSPRAILGRISRAKGEGITAAEFYGAQTQRSFGNRVTAEAWRQYEQTLTEEHALDFDDLIALPVRLLEEYPEILASAQDRWSYVHIDEYQDTNMFQGRLARLLAAKHQNLFVVGDIDQTIYTWRGATIKNLLLFDNTYPSAQTITLGRNYRSTKTIVDAANAVIEKNKNRRHKYSTTERPDGEPIKIRMAVSAEDEARWIALKIKELVWGGTNPESIAVLFRTNFQSRALEEGFLSLGIQYHLLGTHFFARKEVRDVLAWMRLALDLSRETDKIRAAAAPPRGIGRATLAKLAVGQRANLRAADLAKVEAFEKIVNELAVAAEMLCPSEFAKLVIEKSGMKRVLLDEGNDEDRERFENIAELASVAARFNHMPGKSGIAAFIAEAALASDQDELDRTDKNGVALMTVHAAKGLEFDTVFISGMEEGLFPHEDSGREEWRDEEEERRLFYVAITRARNRLFLTLAAVRKMYGSDFITEPSSFLSDIDRSLLVYDESDENVIS